LWWPGDEISLRFTESIECSRPFRFNTSLKLGGTTVPVENTLDLLCEGNKIEVAFGRTLILDPDQFIGKQVAVSVG
jgi:hypothetical protein